MARRKLLGVRSAAMAAVFAVGFTTAAYGGWKKDSVGWAYQNDDGSWQMNGWFTDVDGKSYYLDERCYMLANTTTPDGYQVGADGARLEPVMSLPSNKGDVYYRGARQILDSIPLYPRDTTGYDDLDALLDSIFAQIITQDMDTHDKLKACYDYLINHTVYGANPYYGSSYHYAYGVFEEGIGVCDDYSAAFAVMARKIGVPVYTAGGSTHKSNGDFTPHTWCQLDYNGVTYIFDPQVEDVIANGRGGAIMYIRFAGTTSQLADKYRFNQVMDDFAARPVKQGKNIKGQNTGNRQNKGNRDSREDMDDEDWEDFLRGLFD